MSFSGEKEMIFYARFRSRLRKRPLARRSKCLRWKEKLSCESRRGPKAARNSASVAKGLRPCREEVEAIRLLRPGWSFPRLQMSGPRRYSESWLVCIPKIPEQAWLDPHAEVGCGCAPAGR